MGSEKKTHSHLYFTEIPSIIQQTPQRHSTTVEGKGRGGKTPAHKLSVPLKSIICNCKKKSLWATSLNTKSLLKDKKDLREVDVCEKCVKEHDKWC